MNNTHFDIWNRLVEKDKTATFFQTLAWHELASRYFGTETVVLRFSFENIEAVLPLQMRKKALWSTYASPFGTYTALLSEQKLSAETMEKIHSKLASLNLELFSSPFTQNPIKLGSEIDATTRILDLDLVDAQDITKGWSRNHRRKLADGLEKGITIRLADQAADIEAYYRIYLDLAKSWGEKARIVYPDKLFQWIWEALGANPAMKLWLGESEGKIVAGRICFYHGSHVVEWHAAALGTYLDYGVNHVLIHSIVKNAKATGFKIYDFNPNSNLPKVDHFKSGFGSRQVQFQSSRNLVGLYAGIQKLLGR